MKIVMERRPKLPAVASILSGTYPVQHGIRDNGPYRLSEDWSTLPELLRDAGFATAAFVSSEVLSDAHGIEQGFDLYDADFSAPYEVFDPALAAIAKLHGEFL